MKNILSILIAVSTVVCVGLLQADTIELADGTLLEGDFVGSSNQIIMFDTGDGIEAFPESQVVGIYLSSGVETAEELSAAPGPSYITVPSGTRLVIRMADTIDSKQHGVGHRFRGQLEGALVVDGVTVAPRGTFVHGRIAHAKQSGRAVGKSEMAIEFTDIMIDDQLFEISTSGLSAQTSGEGAKTAGRTARAAAIGGLIGGSSDAKRGAKIGLGASILTSGASINVPRGTILETQLAQEFTVQM
jgi:hypothetical protein